MQEGLRILKASGITCSCFLPSLVVRSTKDVVLMISKLRHKTICMFESD